MLKSKLDKLASFARLRNEAHFEFYRRLFHYLAGNGGAAAFNAGEPFKPAHAAYNEEDAALQQARKSALTPQIEEESKVRSLALQSLKSAVKSAVQKVGAQSWHDKAAFLQAILDKYKVPHGKHASYNELSGVIFNLAEDLAAAPAAGYLQDLGIADRAVSLREQNEKFDKLYDDRITEEGGRVRYDLPAIRERLDQSAWDLANAIAYGADRETYKGKYVAFVNFYNELVAEFQRLIDRSHRRKSPGGEKNPDAGGGGSEVEVKIDEKTIEKP
jgi:hypothetical protein